MAQGAMMKLRAAWREEEISAKISYVRLEISFSAGPEMAPELLPKEVIV